MMYVSHPKSCKSTHQEAEQQSFKVSTRTRYDAGRKTAPIGESPSASYSSFFTSSVTRDPRRSSRVGSNGGSPTSERVDGTKTWSCVMCPVDAWCFAWVTRHEWYGTPTLKIYRVSFTTSCDQVKEVDARRMEEPPDGVVHRLRLRESLMPALVPDDPDARAEEPRPEAVERPQRETCGGVQVGVGEGECGGRDEGISVLRALAQRNNDDQVPDAAKPLSTHSFQRKKDHAHINRRPKRRALEAVGPVANKFNLANRATGQHKHRHARDGIEQLLDGDVGHGVHVLLDDRHPLVVVLARH